MSSMTSGRDAGTEEAVAPRTDGPASAPRISGTAVAPSHKAVKA